MGTTLWCLSRRRQEDGDDFDHSAMLEGLEGLDALCRRLGVKELSSFVDWTDYNVNMQGEDASAEGGDPSGGARWYAPADALPTLAALRSELGGNLAQAQALFDADRQHFGEYLLDELDDCVHKLQAMQEEGDLFQLCVVA